MRYLYSFLFYLALPYIFIRLYWRSRKQPDYRQRLGERLGYYPFKLKKCIWVHAVSVGETIAAIPLIKALQAQYPALPMLVTTMTPTGALRVKAAFGDSVTHAYIPYDLPSAVVRFLDTMNPVVAVIMETELWPNVVAACRKRQVPVCLVNARLSEKSARGYQRIAILTREMLQGLAVIAAHGQADAERFIALGALPERVLITGNIKFDLELPPELAALSATLRDALGKNRFIWIAASTHAGEEELILAAHKVLREKHPQALLVLVPRHPDRFDTIFELCAQTFVTKRRSLQQACTPDTAVYLGDTMGELLLLYGAVDVAFIGGSLIPRGGHNMLEACALEKPVLTGPHLFNFAEISELFINAHALTKVSDASTLANELIQLRENDDARTQMGQRGLQVVAANRGALAKQVSVIMQHVTPSLF